MRKGRHCFAERDGQAERELIVGRRGWKVCGGGGYTDVEAF
jgi:hypothetical protein